MRVLVFNAGSSSLKFGIFDMTREDSRILKGEFERFSRNGCTLNYRIGGETGNETDRPDPATNISAANRLVLSRSWLEFGVA